MDILLKDRGIIPGCTDLNGKINELLDTLEDNQAYKLIFEPGEYHLPVETAVRRVIYMTNTVSEKEMATPNREIGIMLENRRNVTLDGNGASLIYYGRMTEFCLLNCHNVTIENFKVDFNKATVAEFKVTYIGEGNLVTIVPCADSDWDIEGGRFQFEALKIDSNAVMQECDVLNRLTKRRSTMSWIRNPFNAQISAVANEDGSVSIKFPFSYRFKEGLVYQICMIRRDACSTFISESEDIKILNNTYNFMHGMGILAQCSHNITIDSCDIVPNRDKGRTTATFADMIHCAMCSGDIVVNNCTFDGSRDDIINVHGNHYKISSISGSIIEMKYKHAQTYGFNGVRAGDVVEVIHNKYLTPIEKYTVLSSEMADKYTVRIKLDRAVSKAIKKGYLIDNASRQPNLTYTNNEAYNIPTRGMLITTSGKVYVANNIFHKMYMSAILISDDCKNWYESGYVRDVLIENNQFVECHDWIIDVLPEAHSKFKRPMVHKNVVVRNNVIKLGSNRLIRVKRCENFTFIDNEISSGGVYTVDMSDNKNVNSQV